VGDITGDPAFLFFGDREELLLVNGLVASKASANA
jgi:hypothetical protein